jgi:hypothetical protein
MLEIGTHNLALGNDDPEVVLLGTVNWSSRSDGAPTPRS